MKRWLLPSGIVLVFVAISALPFGAPRGIVIVVGLVGLAIFFSSRDRRRARGPR
jgi:uncharacterized membrane protein